MAGATMGAEVQERRENLALGLALLSLLSMIILAAADADGPIWLIQGVTALAAVIVALGTRAAQGFRQKGLIALFAGGALFIAFIIGTATNA